MNIGNNHSVNINNIFSRTASPVNAGISQRTREQAAAKQAESPRTQDWFAEPREMDESNILRPYQPGDREWERLESGFRNYQNLISDDIRNLASMASRLIASEDAESRRGIAEMVSFVEEKLARLDNNPNISEERRDIERRVWEEGLHHALSSSHRGEMVRIVEMCAITGEKRMLIDADDAENEVREAMNFAFEIMQNASSLTSNTRLQEIIRASMDSLIVREIDLMSQMIATFDTNGESDAFRAGMMEYFQNRRNDMIQTSELQINPLRNNLSIFAHLDISI